jgi:hypothetical protein
MALIGEILFKISVGKNNMSIQVTIVPILTYNTCHSDKLIGTESK